MPDEILHLGGAVIHHGPSSDRVYVMKLPAERVAEVLDEIEALARERGYGKIVVKSPASAFGAFAPRGFVVEAVVPSFYGPEEPALFLARFARESRAHDLDAPDARAAIVRSLEERPVVSAPRALTRGESPEVELREATSADADALSRCYDEVFESYPFAIHDSDHLRAEMKRGTRFFTAWDGNNLLAASSMEPGGAPGVVEMTDFATRPDHRGRGLATGLLGLMTRTARAGGLRVACTIARATSLGMNITFARHGYRYGGTLVNNTQIGGTIESMHVWYTLLTDHGRTES